jgi:thiol-disulfide isomerase/thioredoxin
MTALVLVARLLLAGVFAVAAAAKLADRHGSREAVVSFGAPERVAPALALLLPAAELVAAGLLLPATTAAAGAALAAALLLLFSAAIAVNLARGRSPECHCFGQLHSAPASRRTLARNVMLAGVAGLALASALREHDRSAVAWLGRLDGAEATALGVGLGAACLLAAGGAVFLSLLRSYGRVLVRLERVELALANAGLDLGEPERQFGLAPGTPAPPHPKLAALLQRGLPVLLIFSSPRCGPCRALLPLAAAWQGAHRDSLTIAFASDGSEEEVRAEAAELELADVLVDHDLRLYNGFEANGTPSAVLVGADGAIASWLASGADEIERLLGHALEPEPGLPIASDVPELELPSLAGGPVAFGELAGEPTMLLFWNPDCGFCRSMHDELLALEATANGGSPRLVVVSSGDAESTGAEGFRSTVLLDESFRAGGAFRVTGTPMAVLLDADAKVASPVAAGAPAVLALARNGA